ncbi:hydroxymethylbilane synthase [Bdellovibrio reynosensis]|uniref:Hydroxymethylbilane synthase n=1 Tax=Bdellovibrio reynosensis TaxID=2835041 RepID=A0ABY4C762_9BACT|nr:hydroxymethylbilane synthase [Bdellovibrio reynosensis]UOF00816.1 hydroxymethylbilane synthase [Bdellovibrio reynosensis]
MRLKISARKSDLARLQAYMVGDALKKKHQNLEIEYRFKESLGDKNLTEPLWKIPEKGVFTEDFYGELIRGETDMVVHSWKDLPTEFKDDTVIAATLPRADQRDLLLLKKSHFEKIKAARALRVFSSSPRREYNLTEFFKNHLPFGLESVKFESVRGNIPTRIRKLLESTETDGLIVAKAALDRLLTAEADEFNEVRGLLRGYLQELTWMVLPLNVNPNAAAQGALAVEITKGRSDLAQLLSAIHDQSTFDCAQKERDILSSFGGGCHQKIGVAVLHRSYGEITILKGLTDQGVVLEKRDLAGDSPSTFVANQLWSSDVKADRVPLENVKIPAGTSALYVARSEAWPEGLNFAGFVWTAGLKTWKSLAQKGIWVHGCSESLGEQEDARMDILAGNSLAWAKLSHEEGFERDAGVMPLVATYSLKPQGVLNSFTGKESFFWSSGSQFLQAMQEAPEILNKHHACGPGNTYKVIRAYMEKKNAFDPKRLNIFLDQDDWRKQCTK